MNEEELSEEYAVVDNRDYGDYSYVAFNIKCTGSEIEKIVETINRYRGRHNGNLTGSIGTPEYFTWRRARRFENPEEFYKFIDRRKDIEMENLAYQRAYEMI